MLFDKRFPIIYQLDSMDCGPTCLRMISKFYGKDISIEKFRAHSYYSYTGVSLLGISDAAEAIGFRTIAGQVTFEKLKELPLPCILHWNEEHFVVLYKIRRNSIHIADPSGGLLTYARKEFIDLWAKDFIEEIPAGVVLLLEASEEFHKQSEEPDNFKTDGYRYLMTYITKYRALFLQLLIGLLGGSLILLIFPVLMRLIVDVGIGNQDKQFIYLILLGQTVLFFAGNSLQFLRRWILLQISSRVSIALISEFLGKLMRLPVSFFGTKKIGDILQRIDDHERVERFLNTSSLSFVFSVFTLVTFTIVLVFYSVKIFCVFFVLSVIYILYIFWFSSARAKIDYKRFNQLANVRNNVLELINGMPEIRLNNCERYKRWEWERIQSRLFSLNIQATKLLQYQEGGSLFIQELKNILITFIAAASVIEGEITLGSMLSIQYIIGQLNVPLNDLIGFSRDWQDAQLSLERIGEIRRRPNEDDGISSPLPPGMDSNIYIRGLDYQYEGPDSPKVLSNITLEIPQGKVTAIVGVSGSGKTTLLKLLLKFIKPTKGGIYIGNVNLETMPSTEWRRRCGVVMQDGFIFSDTILKNVALSDDPPDLDRFMTAITIANIKEFVDSLPQGYNTRVGLTGVGLSAGQKQRLLIARAVYKDPDFILFDEATSALDARNERIIIDNLEQFFQGRTVVIIAHRLSTVKSAHQIVVLENSNIVEVGSHSSLIQKKTAYFNLVHNQLELGT